VGLEGVLTPGDEGVMPGSVQMSQLANKVVIGQVRGGNPRGSVRHDSAVPVSAARQPAAAADAVGQSGGGTGVSGPGTGGGTGSGAGDGGVGSGPGGTGSGSGPGAGRTAVPMATLPGAAQI